MLTATVNIWPFGRKEDEKRLVTINVANVGRNQMRPDRYDYVWTIDEPNPLFGDPITDEGLLIAYERKAAAVDILSAVLKSHENNLHKSKMNNSDKEIVTKLRDKTLKMP